MTNRTANKAFNFYAITLALAVLVRLAVPVIGEASLMVTMLTPAVAAVIMVTVIAPEGGFRASVARLGLARAGLKGWPLAIGGPALIHLAGLLLLSVLGLTALVAPQIAGSGAGVVVKILVGFLIGTALALGEEVGWRGYMLPCMQGVGIVTTLLLVGLLHGLWHLPLLWTTDYYHATGNRWIAAPLFLITLTLAGVFYGFLRIWTGSVWPVAVAHAAANMAWEIATEVSHTKSGMVLEYVGGESGLIMICGLLVIDMVLIRALRSWAAAGISAPA
jgi:membrane protease YdiL (CAAX protease family)